MKTIDARIKRLETAYVRYSRIKKIESQFHTLSTRFNRWRAHRNNAVRELEIKLVYLTYTVRTLKAQNVKLIEKMTNQQHEHKAYILRLRAAHRRRVQGKPVDDVDFTVTEPQMSEYNKKWLKETSAIFKEPEGVKP